MPCKTIREYKDVLTGTPKTFDCELLEKADGQAIVIYRLQRETVVEGIKMPQGTISYGYFWEQRNYNVYHFVDKNGRTLGFYFNISDSTQISDEQIYWRDLVVDLLVEPEGSFRILDEHELPVDISRDLLQLIVRVRDQIVDRIVEITEEVEEKTKRLTRRQ